MPTVARRRLRLTRRLRRAWAEARFFALALRELRQPAAGLLVSLVAGTVVEHVWGAPPGGEPPAWDVAAFQAWSMLLGEIGGELPADARGQAVMYALPVLGVFFLAEGVLKLGFTVFRKDENREVWMKVLAESSADHIVLVGLGTVGFRVLEELLDLDEQVLVVERDEDAEFVTVARARGVEVLIGDARADHVLRALNVGKARAVIIATDDDLANLEIAMDVRELRVDVPIVMRLFDQRLAQKVRGALGVQVSLSTSRVAAPLFASAALDRRVVGTHRVGDKVLLVFEAAAGAGLVGRTVAGVHREHNFAVVALWREDVGWIVQPGPDEPVLAGDRLQLLVPSVRLEEARGLAG